MKKDKKNLLTAIFVSVLVLSNVLSAKLIALGTWVLPGGIVCYAVTYLMTDTIGELYGKDQANATVRYGLICQVICTALILIALGMPPADKKVGDAYNVVFAQNQWFTLASLVAYLVSQLLDVWIFHGIRQKLKEQSKWKWVWNNTSTIISQGVDTIIFTSIAFGIGCGYCILEGGWAVLLKMIGCQYVAKVVLAVLDTPLFYLITREVKANDSNYNKCGIKHH